MPPNALQALRCQAQHASSTEASSNLSADGVKPIGVRFLTSMPQGLPEIKTYSTDDWEELEEFQAGLKAIQEKFNYALPQDFACSWKTFIDKPPKPRDAYSRRLAPSR